MPIKPDDMVMNAAKQKLNPKDVVIATLNETAALRRDAIDEGICYEDEYGNLHFMDERED